MAYDENGRCRVSRVQVQPKGFLSTYAAVCDTFNVQRHLTSSRAPNYRVDGAAPPNGEVLRAIEVPGDRAFMESITAGPDGTLYVSSLASGGIARIKPGASKAKEWIAPAAFDSRSTFGVFAGCKVKHPMGLF